MVNTLAFYSGQFPARTLAFLSIVSFQARREEVLLTAWSRVLLEKLVLQLIEKFPVFYGTTRKFITVLTSALHLYI